MDTSVVCYYYSGHCIGAFVLSLVMKYVQLIQGMPLRLRAEMEGLKHWL